MDQCFPSCSCDEFKGVSRADLDRFTDKIDNVMNDENGRRLFRNFMYTAGMKDGRKALDLWEHCERLLIRTPGDDSQTAKYLKEVDKILDEAERVEELDFAIMERLTEVRDTCRSKDINVVLQALKLELYKCLKREYNAFRRHYIPKK